MHEITQQKDTKSITDKSSATTTPTTAKVDNTEFNLDSLPVYVQDDSDDDDDEEEEEEHQQQESNNGNNSKTEAENDEKEAKDDDAHKTNDNGELTRPTTPIELVNTSPIRPRSRGSTFPLSSARRSPLVASSYASSATPEYVSEHLEQSPKTYNGKKLLLQRPQTPNSITSGYHLSNGTNVVVSFPSLPPASPKISASDLVADNPMYKSLKRPPTRGSARPNVNTSNSNVTPNINYSNNTSMMDLSFLNNINGSFMSNASSGSGSIQNNNNHSRPITACGNRQGTANTRRSIDITNNNRVKTPNISSKPPTGMPRPMSSASTCMKTTRTSASSPLKTTRTFKSDTSYFMHEEGYTDKIVDFRKQQRSLLKVDYEMAREQSHVELEVYNKNNSARWASKLRRSPFHVDLVAESQRIEEEVHLKAKSTEKSIKGKIQLIKARNTNIIDAKVQRCPSPDDLHREVKRLTHEEGKRLKAIDKVKKAEMVALRKLYATQHFELLRKEKSDLRAMQATL